MDHDAHQETGNRSWRAPLVFIGFAAIAAYFLLSEHRLHALSALPWVLILLACPLMHFFMHGSHGGHGGHGGGDRSNSDAADSGTHHH